EDEIQGGFETVEAVIDATEAEGAGAEAGMEAAAAAADGDGIVEDLSEIDAMLAGNADEAVADSYETVSEVVAMEAQDYTGGDAQGLADAGGDGGGVGGVGGEDDMIMGSFETADGATVADVAAELDAELAGEAGAVAAAKAGAGGVEGGSGAGADGGAGGVEASVGDELDDLIEGGFEDHAGEAGLFVVGDAKRGDIGTSSAHYAAGLLVGEDDGAVGCDALTVSPYLGADALEPFVKAAAATGRGLFALVRTSNPGGDALQGLRLDDGRTVAEAVADVVADLGCGHLGASGYSLLGAVVGATKPEDAASLRQRMPQQVFLVPGFGAQGGTADDVRACFKPDGTGALVTASRSVLYAYNPADDDWPDAVAAAAVELKREVREVLTATG
ncbi:MAG: orotidine-5'-phosphate decarboxylase, partial [Planctomycetota bacterium]